MTREEAKAFISARITLRGAATDEQAATAPAVYPSWRADTQYVIGDRVVYNKILYRVLQDHISQEMWLPDETASLFAKVLIPDNDTIYPWEQPDSTNPYMTGDKVIYNDIVWVSTTDNNVWAPGTYGWEKV